MGLGIVLNRNRQVPAEDSPAFGAIAERFRRAGDLERAVALCQEGLARFPGHLSARVTLGWSFLDLGKYDEARAELEQVLKRAPDNLAAIRGLAELHDRAEHDDLAAMHRDGSKWMTEAAAAATAAAEPAYVAAPVVETRPAPSAAAAAESFVPQPKPAPAVIPAPAPKPPVAAPVVDDELEAGIAALGVFAAPSKATAGTAAVVAPPVPQSFAAPTMAEPARPSVQPAASTFASPTRPQESKTEETSPFQPVEIESAAAHLLEATSSGSWRAPAPGAPHAAPVVPAAWQPEEIPEAAPAFSAATDIGTTELQAGPVDLQEFAEFANLNDGIEAVTPAPVTAGASDVPAEPVARAVAPRAQESVPAVAPPAQEAPAPATRAQDIVPVIDLAAMAPVAADTPTLIQPRVPSLEELDPELPALVDDAWSEQPDVYVLPAAVEAERAIADEGPGVWPPVIPDDPVEAPMAAREPASAAPAEPAPARRPNLGALNKFLRRVETRRSAVVAEYLAG